MRKRKPLPQGHTPFYRGKTVKDIKGRRMYVNATPSQVRKALKGCPGIRKIRTDGFGGTEVIHTCYKTNGWAIHIRLEEAGLKLASSYRRYGPLK
jgi:hypothetical protein